VIGQKHLHSSEQTDDAKPVAPDSSQEESHTITSFLMASLVAMILLIAQLSVLVVIGKRQEAMLDELLRRSGSMQETSVLINPETRSQGERHRNGSGR
jgi:hypothetical protein